jgi:hypothetical protein
VTPYEFDTLMNIAYSRWSAKSYPLAVRERIWFFVKDLPQKAFEKIIYILLDTQRSAPMPNEFKMLAYGERDALGIKQNSEPQTKPSSEAKCWACGDAGNLFIQHKTKKITAVTRCSCTAGTARTSAQGPQWDERLASIYNIVPIYSKGQGNWKPQPGQSALDMINALRRSPLSKKRSGELTSADDIIRGLKMKSEQGETK